MTSVRYSTRQMLRQMGGCVKLCWQGFHCVVSTSKLGKYS
jgi:hypothetical protein